MDARAARRRVEMESRTASVVVQAPREEVYSFLSRTENAPEWATEFVRELKVVDGKHKAITPMGEVFFRVEADEGTGVVDVFAGPAEGEMAISPGRVVALPRGTTAFLFTLFRPPGVSEEEFAGQFESLQRELGNLRRRFSRP